MENKPGLVENSVIAYMDFCEYKSHKTVILSLGTFSFTPLTMFEVIIILSGF